jgi:hypothetical protein
VLFYKAVALRADGPHARRAVPRCAFYFCLGVCLCRVRLEDAHNATPTGSSIVVLSVLHRAENLSLQRFMVGSRLARATFPLGLLVRVALPQSNGLVPLEGFAVWKRELAHLVLQVDQKIPVMNSSPFVYPIAWITRNKQTERACVPVEPPTHVHLHTSYDTSQEGQ